MSRKKKEIKSSEPYLRVPSEAERIRKVKTQIENILVENKMGLAPVVILTGDKIVSRVDIVSTENQPTK